MIGLVLVTHGNLAQELLAAMQHVVGPQTAVQAVCIFPDDDMSQRRADIQDRLRRRGQRQGRHCRHRPVWRHAVEPGDLAARGA